MLSFCSNESRFKIVGETFVQHQIDTWDNEFLRISEQKQLLTEEALNKILASNLQATPRGIPGGATKAILGGTSFETSREISGGNPGRIDWDFWMNHNGWNFWSNHKRYPWRNLR